MCPYGRTGGGLHDYTKGRAHGRVPLPMPASAPTPATAWGVRLPRASALTAGRLRLRGDIEVCDADGDVLWLRGPALTDDLDLELRKLPGGVRYHAGPGGRLTALGDRLPSDRLPAACWRPLATWLAPAPQPAALAGERPAAVPVRLVRTGREAPAAVLVTTLAAWVEYATTAPQARLRPLRFAASADGRAVLWGTPVPPLPGRRFVERDGVAVPAGYAWSPAVDAGVLREVFGMRAGDLVLLDEAGGYEWVAAGDFARASRSGARATADRERS